MTIRVLHSDFLAAARLGPLHPWAVIPCLLIAAAAIGSLLAYPGFQALAAPQASETEGRALVSPHLERAIQRSVRRAGVEGLLSTLGRALADDPGLVLDAEKSGELARLSIRTLAGNGAFDARAVGEITALFSSMAPDDRRSEVVATVTSAVVMEVLELEQTPTLAVQEEIREAPERSAAVKRGTDRLDGGGSTAGDGVPPARAEVEKSEATDADEERRGSRVPKLGGFLIYPDVIVSELYDSNIFATRNRVVDDYVTVISPYMLANSAWSRHLLRMEASADLGRYADNEDENYNDYWFSTEGRLDMGRRSSLFGGFRWGRYHEGRESPDDVLGTEPTKYNQSRAYAGASSRLGRLGVRVSGTYRKFDFKSVLSPGGIISNNLRDRELYTGGARLTYHGSSGTRYYVQGAADIRRYNLAPLPGDVARDSEGMRIIAGVAFEPSTRLKGDIYGGYLEQKFDDPLLPDVEGAAFGADLDWTASERTSVTAFLDRSVNETTIPGASATLSTMGGVRIDHQLAQKSEVGIGFDVGRSDFKGTTRRDNVINANSFLKHYLSRFIFVEALYRFRHLHSTEVLEDYDRHQVLLRVGAQAYPTDSIKLSSAGMGVNAGSPSVFNGAYAGVQAGFGNLNTNLTGPRGSLNETVTSDFGGTGATWGIFGGYGIVFSGIYLGAEVEGEATSAKWSFTRGDLVRSFSVRKRLAYGGSARLGLVLRDSILLYGRAGAVRTEFINRYQFGAVVIDDDFTRTGLRLGLGAEFQVQGGLFLRLDYVYTDFSDYEIDYETGVDTFDNDENALRGGFLFRF